MKLFKNMLFGAVTGAMNGLLGAGGGMVAVPVLKKQMEVKQAHATSIAIILPMSIASAVSYILNGSVKISDAVPYLWGVFYRLISKYLEAFPSSTNSSIILNPFFSRTRMEGRLSE